MKTYEGKRLDVGEVLVRVNDDGVVYSLPHFVRHSPTGFEWGYGGSGPADLALAILKDLWGRMPSVQEYQSFKFAKLAGIQEDEWVLTEDEINAFFLTKDLAPMDGDDWDLVQTLIKTEARRAYEAIQLPDTAPDMKQRLKSYMNTLLRIGEKLERLANTGPDPGGEGDGALVGGGAEGSPDRLRRHGVFDQ